ncbi:MAG TPA: argininosuccinate synthase domain-containing protein [Luteibaculaceae bacterium]|nr:argininosuccinate synthase domain-containing protein [Luteibaculaceae bacterium]
MKPSTKLVLAFSGGLDTTFCAVYLHKEMGYEVHALCVNTGGFSSEELRKMEQHANRLPLASFEVANRTQAFYDDCVKYLLFANALKNQTYPLSVSAERVTQAIAVAEYANAIGASAIAHGSTGAGNDQVRFDMVFSVLCPQIQIITPIRDLGLSREAEVSYLLAEGIDYNPEKAVYSINKGLWGTSVGGRETLVSRGVLPEEAFPVPVSKSESEMCSIRFLKGEPVALNGVELKPVELIQALESLAGPFGIGRDIHVGDTIIGMKGRVGFASAAAMILLKAHHLLEKHVLTKSQLLTKDQLSTWYGHWVHEGQFLDPVMRDIEAFLSQSQQRVSGEVFVQLHPYRFVLEGVKSDFDLMDPRFGSYGESNTLWNGQDVRGFAKIYANQAQIFNQVSVHHEK